MNMEIKHEETGKKGEFFIEQDGERVARLQYFGSAEGQITIYHTEVNEALQGKHIGNDLVRAAVDMARKDGLKIVPQCPFARKVIEDAADMTSVLA